MEKIGYVYILTNPHNRVLYTGVTSNLSKRVWEHKGKRIKGFTKKYNCDKLVYYEDCRGIWKAIEREKQIKKWARKYKVALILKMNPLWQDLSHQIIN